MNIIGGYQDTRTNNEDIALTPYLYGVFVKGDIIKVFGFGLCWGYYSIYVGLGFNLPKEHRGFKILNN